MDNSFIKHQLSVDREDMISDMFDLRNKIECGNPYKKLRPEPNAKIHGVEVDFNNLPKEITLKQWKATVANTAGFEALYHILDDEAFIHATQHILNNCSRPERSTYDYALQYIFVPELLRRLDNGTVRQV